MAVALPLLLALVTALAGFGITFTHYLALTDAARTGARTASVSANAPDPVGTATQAVKNAAGDLDQSQLNVGVTSTWQPGTPVTVTATYPFSISVFGVPVWSGTLQSSTTDRVE